MTCWWTRRHFKSSESGRVRGQGWVGWGYRERAGRTSWGWHPNRWGLEDERFLCCSSWKKPSCLPHHGLLRAHIFPEKCPHPTCPVLNLSQLHMPNLGCSWPPLPQGPSSLKEESQGVQAAVEPPCLQPPFVLGATILPVSSQFL